MRSAQLCALFVIYCKKQSHAGKRRKIVKSKLIDVEIIVIILMLGIIHFSTY